MENNTNDETIYTCPNCGNQVNVGDERCSKCGTELSLETENEDKETTIVIRSFINEFEAEMAKSMLDEEGIECFISKDDEGSMGLSLQYTNGVDLHIFEKDKEKAEEVLKAMND